MILSDRKKWSPTDPVSEVPALLASDLVFQVLPGIGPACPQGLFLCPFRAPVWVARLAATHRESGRRSPGSQRAIRPAFSYRRCKVQCSPPPPSWFPAPHLGK